MSNDIDLPGTLATVHGVLGDDLLEILAAETLLGHRQEAMGLLRTYAIPDCLDVRQAGAFVDALMEAGRQSRSMDGPSVLEDLTVQPCQAEVMRLAGAGAVHAAALVAIVHEGYPAAAALAATAMMATSQQGKPVDLVESDLAAVSGELEASRETVVVRIGSRILSGHVRRIGDTTVFDGGGEPVRLGLVEQAWRASPKATARG